MNIYRKDAYIFLSGIMMKSIVFGFMVFSIFISNSFAVEYFGYFADAMSGVGNGNYIPETGNSTNLNFISAPFENGISNEWREKVLLSANYKNKSILMLEGFLFEWRTLKLNTSHHQLLSQLKLKLNGLENNIQAVYLIDEPYFKNSLSTKPLTIQEVYLNLQSAAKIIKIYFPNAKIIITEAYPLINSSFEVPSEIDWIGVNCYLAFGEVCSVSQIRDMTSLVSKKLKSNQRIVFTLDSYWNNSSYSDEETQLAIVARNKEILKIAEQYDAIAFFPFLYQSDLAGEQLHGANSMPIVLNFLNQIGQSIKKNTFKYPSECNVLPPKCEGKDYVRRDSCGKEIERWRNAPAPYCVETAPVPVPAPSCIILDPKCEGKDYVRRDSCGKEIERWRNAPAPYCVETAPVPVPAPSCIILDPKCEGKDYVRRDSCGKEIERWRNAPAPYCKLPN